ncbi:MAG: TIGR01777 family protein [Pseudomonadales bacterium]|nr:TIGR01777 family oxidoreductase [Halioglobus sp.]MCP5131814.1 TIGR01777 family protein [Pseudomonadales bacterium]
MNFLLTGGTGFIGSALVEAWCDANHCVTVLTRRPRARRRNVWYVTSLDAIAADTRFDAVVNLAGASLAGARWTPAYKREIVSSRLNTTAAVVALLHRLEHPPATLLSASAIGYYGHHGDEPLDEDATPAPGFSHDLCQRWEAAALQAADGGTRVCLLRLGVVLDGGGGALQEMARPFRFGVANWVGDGRQWLSWVHRRDVIAAIGFLLQRPDLSGPFNVTAPNPVTAREFCGVMKRNKRTLVTAPVPAPVIRLLVGEMAQELLLHGQRVVPARLEAAGFDFSLPGLDAALAECFAR